MFKARLVITAVVEQHRRVAEVAAAYGAHRAWVYKLLARYRAEGRGGLPAPLPAPEDLTTGGA
jgi:hypothetical protein